MLREVGTLDIPIYIIQSLLVFRVSRHTYGLLLFAFLVVA